MSRPNILFFFTDQQRWDTCGCYGQKLPVTPNLDSLAGEGVIFENAFTCQPVCGPARACLMSGKWATETGCFRNSIPLPEDERTTAKILGEAGYETAYIGKWHLAGKEYKEKGVPPERRGGFKDFWLAAEVLEHTSHGYDGHMWDADGNQVDFKGYRVDRVTDFALEYLDGRDSDRPFFLTVSYLEPHHQNDRNRYEGPDGSREKWKDYEVPGDLADTEGDWQENYPDYLGCCNSLDGNLRRIVDKLGEMDILDDTLIIYSSDHGSHFRTRNSEYKRSCHDGCLRVPMVLHGPGFMKGNRVTEAMASIIDIPPTILRAAGVGVPSYMRGRPLQEAADGRPDDWRSEIFAQISEASVSRCIRTHKWKYSVVASGLGGGAVAGSDSYTEDYLYDLEADPHERNNLVTHPEYSELRAELAERLKRRMVEAGEDEPEISRLAGA